MMFVSVLVLLKFDDECDGNHEYYVDEDEYGGVDDDGKSDSSDDECDGDIEDDDNHDNDKITMISIKRRL